METQYSLIKQALNSEQEKLVMENIIFKYNTLSRKITKLEKVKKLQILNSNLEEINYFPPNIEELIVNNCSLEGLSTCEISNKIKVLLLQKNQLQFFLEGDLLINLTELNLSSNLLTDIPIMPKSIIKLDLSINKIEHINNLSENINLREIILGDNLIADITGLPISITYLNICKNKIEYIDLTVYKKLTVLKAYSNSIKLIVDVFPETLEYVDLSQNNLKTTPIFTKNVSYLDLSHNNLEEFPKFDNIDSLQYLDILTNDDMSLTDETITTLITLKRTINICLFDQFQMNIQSDSELDYNLTDLSKLSFSLSSINSSSINSINSTNSINSINSTKNILLPFSSRETEEIETEEIEIEEIEIEEEEIQIKIKEKIVERIPVILKRSYCL